MGKPEGKTIWKTLA